MATYEKPTSIPRWDDDETNLTEPSEGKKDVGWEVDEIPPSSWENWKSNLIGNWFKWIDERIVDTDSGNGWSILNPSSGDVAWGLSNQSGPGLYPFLWTEIEEIQFLGEGDTPTLTFQTDSGHEAWISYDRVLEYMYLHVHDEDVLLLTGTTARFKAGHTLFPATTETGNIGASSYYWAKAYVKRIYESSPLVWYGYLDQDVEMINGSDNVITPHTAIALNDIVVTGAGAITFAENGLYRISCDFLVKADATSRYLSIRACIIDAVVTNSVQLSYFDSTEFIAVHYEVVAAISDHTTQNVNIRGIVITGTPGSKMTIAGGSGDESYSHMNVEAIYIAP